MKQTRNATEDKMNINEGDACGSKFQIHENI